MIAAAMPANEACRLRALADLQILDTPPEQAYDDLTRLAATICGTPMALVSLIADDRQWFKSRHGCDLTGSSRAEAFCSHTIHEPAVLHVPDATKDERFRDNPFVTQPPHIRMYAGVPLRLRDGLAMGSLCVIDAQPRSLTPAQLSALEALGRQVVAQLELRQHIIELMQAREAAEESAATMARFLADMSHEIRTPLTTVLGYCELLQDESEPAALRREWLSTVSASGGHLLALVNNVLDFSKLGAKQMRFDPQPSEVRALVNEVVSSFRLKAEESGIELGAMIGVDVPPWVGVDALRLRQVLVNLVGNAVKFAPRGSVQVTVVTEQKRERYDLVVRVSDTGPGIAEADRERIFSPFRQSTEAGGPKIAGTGLGLPISRQICESMGGSLTLTSEVGKGSTFIARVPLIAAAPPQAEAEPVPPVRSGHLLLVDDVELNRRMVRLALERAGFTVEEAGNGRQALDLMAEQPFDVVLLDMQMPVLDGYATARLARKAGHAMPILAVTANAAPQDRDRCLDAGCTAYLAKPVATPDLLRAIAKACASPRRAA